MSAHAFRIRRNEQATPNGVGELEVRRPASERAPGAAEPPKKSRAERFAEAHAWVLEQHAGTFEKLAK